MGACCPKCEAHLTYGGQCLGCSYDALEAAIKVIIDTLDSREVADIRVALEKALVDAENVGYNR